MPVIQILLPVRGWRDGREWHPQKALTADRKECLPRSKEPLQPTPEMPGRDREVKRQTDPDRRPGNSKPGRLLDLPLRNLDHLPVKLAPRLADPNPAVVQEWALAIVFLRPAAALDLCAAVRDPGSACRRIA